MKDELSLNNDLGVKGRVTVELINAETGEVEFKETKNNFIGNGYKLWAKYIQKREILSNVLGVNEMVDYSNSDCLNAPTPFTMVVLTDDDSEEDPDEFGYKGDVIGYAFRDKTYAGDSKTRGTINTAETTKGKNKITHIFDFPTHVANGTFQSINFASFKEGYDGQSYAKEVISGLEFNDKDKIAYRDGYIWLLMNEREVKKYNPEDDTVEDLFALGFDSYGVDYYNGHIYITSNVSSSYTSKIYKYDLEGNLIDTTAVSLPYLASLVCAEDGYWILSNSSDTHNLTGMQYRKAIYKLDLNGNIVDYKELPSYVQYSSDFDIEGDTLIFSRGDISNILFNALDCINLSNGEVRTFRGYCDGVYSISIIDASKGILYGATKYYSPYYLTKIQLAGLSSRVLLTAPQTKNNTQTMKVTYELMFDDLI